MVVEYKTEASIQIRYSDIDSMNHVNNAIYLTYLETARVHYFNHVLEGLLDWENYGIILARTEIDYLFPLYLNNQPKVKIAITELKNKSFVMQYEIQTHDPENRIHAKAKTILVCFDYKKNASISIPDFIRNRITEFENLN